MSYRTELKHALYSVNFLIALLGTVMTLLMACVEMLIPLFRVREQAVPLSFLFIALQQAITADTMKFALPIIAALPYSASCYDDFRSGFIKEYLPRSGYRNYITGKQIACFVSGGTALIAGVVCFGVLTYLSLLPRVFFDMSCASTIKEIRTITAAIMMLFLSGGFWAMFGLMAAVLTNSKSMGYASSFILFYSLVILGERYFKKIILVNPKNWISPSLGVSLLLVFLILLVILAFSISVGRRLRCI